MKKILTISSFIFSLIFASFCLTISCASNSNLQTQNSSSLETLKTLESAEKSNSNSKSKSENSKKSLPPKMWTIVLNDNCPQTTAALKAEMALKSTIENYDGTQIFTYDENAPEKSLEEFKTYLSYCEQIKESIKKFSAKSECSLEFNTQNDASGETLDFSSSEKILQNLKYLSQNKILSVWAIYKF